MIIQSLSFQVIWTLLLSETNTRRDARRLPVCLINGDVKSSYIKFHLVRFSAGAGTYFLRHGD